MQNDMTKGSPLRLIVFFTIPVLLGNIFQNVYNLMDSIIVGRFLGVNALAAVGATGTLTFLVFGWVTGMTGGFGILLAQSFGAGDEKRLRHYTVMSIYLCVAMAVLMTAGLLLANRGILKLMNTPDTILDDTAGYIGIIYAGLPVTIAYNMLSSVSRSLGDSRTPLIFLIISSVLNIILDIVFVSRFQMGVAGVAYATVIAQAVSAILCFWKLLRMTDIFDFKFRHLKMKKKYTLEIIRLGLPSGITQAIFSMAMVIVQSLTNSFGAMVIAANVIIMRVDGFAMMPNFSFGTAMTTYAGQNVGAHRMDRVEQGARQGTAIALGTSAVITLLILVFGKNLMAIFTDTSELVTLSANMMKILAVGYLAMAITQSLSGVMRGAGDTMTPMWISMITTVVIRVPLAYGLAFLTRTPELPNGRYQVLWSSLLVCWCMGALLTFLFYKRGNWKKKALTANTNA